jgi:hypothetical protein
MFRCPKTERTISAGRTVEIAAFRSTPVFFGRTYCPVCNVVHEWFAKDAWVCDSEPSECEAEYKRPVVAIS